MYKELSNFKKYVLKKRNIKESNLKKLNEEEKTVKKLNSMFMNKSYNQEYNIKKIYLDKKYEKLLNSSDDLNKAGIFNKYEVLLSDKSNQPIDQIEFKSLKELKQSLTICPNWVTI